MEWGDKSVTSSMLKHPIAGPLIVHADRIEGNVFANPQAHGTVDSVLYAFGMKSILHYMAQLGRTDYVPGSAGETVTVDDLDEAEVSVGDIFQFGEVRAQAVYPRIPCGKVDIRMQHPEGQKLMQTCGRSGIYFRILKPGQIFKTDVVERVESNPHRFPISRLYQKMVNRESLTLEEMKLALANGAFPKRNLETWAERVKQAEI